MTGEPIRTLFAHDINRRIEEVIKVDQTDEAIIVEEIDEYVLTKTIRNHYRAILERYAETPNKPHEGIAVWVSGFFGSGKSSFAKLLGYALANRPLLGHGAATRFATHAGDNRIEVLLSTIGEHIPTHAVIFDISTDAGIKTGSQKVTEIMYRLFLQSLGYARDLDLAGLEIALETDGKLQQFEERFERSIGKSWNDRKGLVALAIGEASRVMHELEPETYPSADSWMRGNKQRADITPGLLAERCQGLMKRRRPGHALLFVIDEVGQFVARDVQKMLDLQAVVQQLGVRGRGSMWMVVTSQEKLNELVGGLDDKRVELARLNDRFPSELQVNLEPADISEVTSRRVLSKGAGAEAILRPLFDSHRGALEAHTRLTANIKLPELTAERFIDLYPLLPYQVDLIIQVVSGLRTQGGTSKHVGGANRTIIKLAQQLLINPAVQLAEQPVGALVRLDHIYDLVEGNIASDIRGKIAALPDQVDHPLAQSVAKVICLLQYVQSVHRTADNIAAALYPCVGADSRLTEVRAALEELEARHQVRRGDDGYRIPTPAEDDWERQRNGLNPSSGDARAIYTDIVAGLWNPQPMYALLGTKTFKAGLVVGGQTKAEGDVPVYLQLAQASEWEATVSDMRARSKTERGALFWVARLDDAIDREMTQVYRSKEILSRKARGAQGLEAARLVSDEERRRKDAQENLRRRLKQAMLRGFVYFRGNDRSPSDQAVEVEATVKTLLGEVLKDVFDRYSEAAAKVQQKEIDTVLTADSLHGLPAVISKLNLLTDQGGKPVFAITRNPLQEILARIDNRASYGEIANGQYLAEQFAQPPFGWDFDTVRLLLACLLRARAVEMTSKGQIVEAASSVEARSVFASNNLFRQAAFRPRKTSLSFEDLINAAQAYTATFGRDVRDLELQAIAMAIREDVTQHEGVLQEAHTTLVSEKLPGVNVLAGALNQTRAIRTAKQEAAITSFTAAHKEIGEAIRRAAELRDTLNDQALKDLRRAHSTLDNAWPFLKGEPDLNPGTRAAAEELDDLLRKETFFREIAQINLRARILSDEFARREQDALERRKSVYDTALQQLAATPGWEQLDEDQRAVVAQPLRCYATTEAMPGTSIPQIRAETDACSGRLAAATEALLRSIGESRLAKVSVTPFFAGGIENDEQLNAALTGLHDAIAHLLGEGKKVLVQ